MFIKGIYDCPQTPSVATNQYNLKTSFQKLEHHRIVVVLVLINANIIFVFHVSTVSAWSSSPVGTGTFYSLLFVNRLSFLLRGDLDSPSHPRHFSPYCFWLHLFDL